VCTLHNITYDCRCTMESAVHTLYTYCRVRQHTNTHPKALQQTPSRLPLLPAQTMGGLAAAPQIQPRTGSPYTTQHNMHMHVHMQQCVGVKQSTSPHTQAAFLEAAVFRFRIALDRPDSKR
jgi:hypothetical protein